jgi:hypothetical protein
MRKSLTVLTLSILTLGLAFGGFGCGTFGYTIAKRDSIDKAIAAARADTEAKLTALGEQKVKTLQDLIKTHEGRAQLAADYLFKGSAVFGTLKADQISRHTLVMGQSIQQTSAQLPPATALAQAETFKALQKELDESRVSTQALIAQYEKELGLAKAQGEAKAKELVTLGAKVQAVEAEKATVLGKALITEQDLQTQKDKIQNKALADKTREAEEAKSVQAIKLKMSAITGVLALLCLAGAIYSPVFKQNFGIGAAILGLATVAIWYIQPWHVGLAIGVGLLVLVAWAAKNHYIESKAATGVYRAVQAVKDNATEDYERILKPKLTEWLTTYDKTGKAVPDKAAIQHIDEVLMKNGDL